MWRYGAHELVLGLTGLFEGMNIPSYASCMQPVRITDLNTENPRLSFMRDGHFAVHARKTLLNE
jgi:hypothetical protein